MGLTVLSLCDGISTGQQVLKELNIEVDKYFSSEIEKSAMMVTQYHFPNTIQIGDIFKVKYDNGILSTENGDFEVYNEWFVGEKICYDVFEFTSDGYLTDYYEINSNIDTIYILLFLDGEMYTAIYKLK